MPLVPGMFGDIVILQAGVRDGKVGRTGARHIESVKCARLAQAVALSFP